MVKPVGRSGAAEGQRDDSKQVELEHLYATAPVGMCLVDTNLRYLRINERLAAINGNSIEEHLGRTLREVIPNVAPHIEPIYQQVLATGQPVLNVEVSTEVPSDPGVERAYLVSHHPVRASSGEIVAVSTTVNDITALKRAETDLARAKDELESRVRERTAELTRANEVLEEQVERRRELEDQLRLRQRMDSIGSLAGGIAHDFNNLLQGIVASQSLLDCGPDPLSEQQATCVRDCLDACNRAAALTRRLGTLSAGTVSQRKATDVHSIASEVFSLLEQTTNRLITKRVDFGPDNFVVHAAPSELHQVLLNLATNAARAIDGRPGGPRPDDQITLSAARHAVQAGDVRDLAAGAYVHLRFADTGEGMSADVKRRAFEPLFTTRDRTEQRGQGLGLAMVYNIVVNGHGGHVELESAEGEGTTVHVYLPESSPDPEGAREVRPWDDLRGGVETILVIDDDEFVRKTAAGILTMRGYRVVTAVDGEHGLAQFVEHRPDLCIVDLIMPKRSGESLCNQILRVDQAARIVISSGDAGRRIDEPSLSGARAILQKPYEAADLLRAVRRVLDEK